MDVDLFAAVDGGDSLFRRHYAHGHDSTTRGHGPGRDTRPWPVPGCSGACPILGSRNELGAPRPSPFELTRLERTVLARDQELVALGHGPVSGSLELAGDRADRPSWREAETRLERGDGRLAGRHLLKPRAHRWVQRVRWLRRP